MINPPSYYEFHVFCCLNERAPGNSQGCCMSRGAEPLFEYFKKQVKKLDIPLTRVNRAGCLDRCEFGPTIVIYPEGIWYKVSSKEDVDKIIREHLQQRKPVASLQLPIRE